MAAPAPQRVADVLAGLTDRERKVLSLIAQDRTSIEIAAGLFLCETAEKTQVGRIFTKLGSRDQPDPAGRGDPATGVTLSRPLPPGAGSGRPSSGIDGGRVATASVS